MASSTAGADLLQASLTGELPPDIEAQFTAEREKGNTAYRQLRYTDAIHHYTNAEIINPLSPLPPANRSMVYLKLERWQQARDEATVALELQRALPPQLHVQSLVVKLLLRRAEACKKLMLFAVAVDDYAAVLAIEAQHVLARTELDFLCRQYCIQPPSISSVRAAPVNPLPPRSSSSNGEAERRVDARLGNVENASSRIRVVSESDVDDLSLGANGVDNRAVHVSGVRSASPVVHAGGGSNTASTQGNAVGAAGSSPLHMLSETAFAQLCAKVCEVPPETPADFERAWRCLHADARAQGRYLVETVGARRVRDAGVIGHLLSAQLLERVAFVFSQLVSDDGGGGRGEDGDGHVGVGMQYAMAIADVLEAFVHVERFVLVMMFLSPIEKAVFSKLFDTLAVKGVCNEVIESLRESYG